MGYTCVPHMYPIWGTWGTYRLCTPFWGTYFNQSLICMIKNIPGWVTLVYLTCTSIEVLEVHIDSVPHFEVHNSINQ